MQIVDFDLEEALGYLIKRTGRTMSSALRQKFAQQDLEIPIEHWGILVHLWYKDGQSQKDLAESVFKDKATITRAIGMLEKLNIVVRITDKTDKRHNLIYLTHKGKALQPILIPLALEVKQEATKGIPQEEIDVCKKVLKKIHENLNKSFHQ